MKKGKRLLMLGFFVVMLLAFAGCQEQPPVQTYPKPTAYRPADNAFTIPPTQKDPLEDAYKANPQDFVAFTRSATEPLVKYVPLQQIMEYQTQYPDCNSTWFRSQLSGEDLCIYNAYVFAMEYGYTFIELYVQDCDRDVSFIREAVALDSPFLEQNVSRYGEYKFESNPNFRGDYISLHIDQFTPERKAQREYVLGVCQRIVAQMPESCGSDWEKAEYLYRYVCDHVQYEIPAQKVGVDYLYDAVWRGKSHCDGYSNMLSLLLNLAGIESCEAMCYSYPELSDFGITAAGGHTWVVAKIDGKYYNFDPTWEDTKESNWGNDLAFFGYSDRLVPVKYLRCDQLRPECTDTSRDFPYADLTVKDIAATKNIKAVANLVRRRLEEGDRTTFIVVTGDFSGEDLIRFKKKFGNYAPEVKHLQMDGLGLGECFVLVVTAE